MGFSTLNESKLHNSLKILYQELYEGQTEVEQDGHVYDIVTKNGNVIEIQTKNLAKLLPKILDTIEKGHNVKLVHPIPLVTRIEFPYIPKEFFSLHLIFFIYNDTFITNTDRIVSFF